jgi:hypothetical protein
MLPRKLIDVCQVRAICHPEYDDYVDVIILPSKGERSLASLLAGGGMPTLASRYDLLIINLFC